MKTASISRRRTRLALAWLAVVGIAAAAQAGWLWQEARERQAEAALARAPVEATGPTAAAGSGAAAAGGTPATSGSASASSAVAAIADLAPRHRFARAQALAAAGQDEAAQALYGKLQDDTPLGQAARFNSANGLVRQAVELRAGPQAGQALPALELAKALYRDILRADPAHWPARYNLERAQRLLPEPEPPEASDAIAPRQRERSATTVRGQSQGMP